MKIWYGCNWWFIVFFVFLGNYQKKPQNKKKIVQVHQRKRTLAPPRKRRKILVQYINLISKNFLFCVKYTGIVSVNLCFIFVCAICISSNFYLSLFTWTIPLIDFAIKLWLWNRFHDVTTNHFSVRSFRKRARKILLPFCFCLLFFYLSSTKWKLFAFCSYTTIMFLFKLPNQKQFVSSKLTFLPLPTNPSLNWVFSVVGFFFFLAHHLRREFFTNWNK